MRRRGCIGADEKGVSYELSPGRLPVRYRSDEVLGRPMRDRRHRAPWGLEGHAIEGVGGSVCVGGVRCRRFAQLLRVRLRTGLQLRRGVERARQVRLRQGDEAGAVVKLICEKAPGFPGAFSLESRMSLISLSRIGKVRRNP